MRRKGRDEVRASSLRHALLDELDRGEAVPPSWKDELSTARRQLQDSASQAVSSIEILHESAAFGGNAPAVMQAIRPRDE